MDICCVGGWFVESSTGHINLTERGAVFGTAEKLFTQ